MKKILVTLLLSSLFPVVAQAQPGVIRIPDKPISTTENPNIGKTADFNLLVTRMEKMEKEMKALTSRNEALQKRVSELETLQKADDSGKLPLKMVVSGLDATVNKLVKQQAEDDKNTVSVKLLLTGLDKSVTELKGLFDNHIHQTNFSYSTLDDLLGQPGNNKGNFYIPFVWLGSKGSSVSKVEKIKSVYSFKGKTGTPLQPTQ